MHNLPLLFAAAILLLTSKTLSEQFDADKTSGRQVSSMQNSRARTDYSELGDDNFLADNTRIEFASEQSNFDSTSLVQDSNNNNFRRTNLGASEASRWQSNGPSLPQYNGRAQQQQNAPSAIESKSENVIRAQASDSFRADGAHPRPMHRRRRAPPMSNLCESYRCKRHRASIEGEIDSIGHLQDPAESYSSAPSLPMRNLHKHRLHRSGHSLDESQIDNVVVSTFGASDERSRRYRRPPEVVGVARNAGNELDALSTASGDNDYDDDSADAVVDDVDLDAAAAAAVGADDDRSSSLALEFESATKMRTLNPKTTTMKADNDPASEAMIARLEEGEAAATAVAPTPSKRLQGHRLRRLHRKSIVSAPTNPLIESANELNGSNDEDFDNSVEDDDGEEGLNHKLNPAQGSSFLPFAPDVKSAYLSVTVRPLFRKPARSRQPLYYKSQNNTSDDDEDEDSTRLSANEDGNDEDASVDDEETDNIKPLSGDLADVEVASVDRDATTTEKTAATPDTAKATAAEDYGPASSRRMQATGAASNEEPHASNAHHRRHKQPDWWCHQDCNGNLRRTRRRRLSKSSLGTGMSRQQWPLDDTGNSNNEDNEPEAIVAVPSHKESSVCASNGRFFGSMCELHRYACLHKVHLFRRSIWHCRRRRSSLEEAREGSSMASSSSSSSLLPSSGKDSERADDDSGFEHEYDNDGRNHIEDASVAATAESTHGKLVLHIGNATVEQQSSLESRRRNNNVASSTSSESSIASPESSSLEASSAYDHTRNHSRRKRRRQQQQQQRKRERTLFRELRRRCDRRALDDMKIALLNQFNGNTSAMFKHFDLNQNNLIEARELWPRTTAYHGDNNSSSSSLDEAEIAYNERIVYAQAWDLHSRFCHHSLDNFDENERYSEQLEGLDNNADVSVRDSNEKTTTTTSEASILSSSKPQEESNGSKCWYFLDFTFQPHFQWNPCALSHLLLFDLRHPNELLDYNKFDSMFSNLVVDLGRSSLSSPSLYDYGNTGDNINDNDDDEAGRAYSSSNNDQSSMSKQSHLGVTDGIELGLAGSMSTRVIIGLGQSKRLTCLPEFEEPNVGRGNDNLVGDNNFVTQSLTIFAYNKSAADDNNRMQMINNIRLANLNIRNFFTDGFTRNQETKCEWVRYETDLSTLHDSHVIVSHSRPQRDREAQKMPQVQLVDAQLYLSGHYKCKCIAGIRKTPSEFWSDAGQNSLAVNKLIFEHTYFVQVLAKPRVTVKPHFQWSLPGSRISFECHHDYIDTSPTERSTQTIELKLANQLQQSQCDKGAGNAICLNSDTLYGQTTASQYQNYGQNYSQPIGSSTIGFAGVNPISNVLTATSAAAAAATNQFGLKVEWLKNDRELIVDSKQFDEITTKVSTTTARSILNQVLPRPTLGASSDHRELEDVVENNAGDNNNNIRIDASVALMVDPSQRSIAEQNSDGDNYKSHEDDERPPIGLSLGPELSSTQSPPSLLTSSATVSRDSLELSQETERGSQKNDVEDDDNNDHVGWANVVADNNNTDEADDLQRLREQNHRKAKKETRSRGNGDQDEEGATSFSEGPTSKKESAESLEQGQQQTRSSSTGNVCKASSRASITMAAGRLELERLKPSDAGQYTCRVEIPSIASFVRRQQQQEQRRRTVLMQQHLLRQQQQHQRYSTMHRRQRRVFNDNPIFFEHDQPSNASRHSIEQSLRRQRRVNSGLFPSESSTAYLLATHDQNALWENSVGSNVGSLLVQEQPTSPFGSDQIVGVDVDGFNSVPTAALSPVAIASAQTSHETRLWMFHDNGISVYKLQNDDGQEMELLREINGHSIVRAEVDGNWNQLTLCGGLNQEQVVICEWSDNALYIEVGTGLSSFSFSSGSGSGSTSSDSYNNDSNSKENVDDSYNASKTSSRDGMKPETDLRSKDNEASRGRGQEQRTSSSITSGIRTNNTSLQGRKYIYVGQPNLNRVIVLDGLAFEIVAIINTEPQPRRLFPFKPNKIHLTNWVRRRLSPVANARWLAAIGKHAHSLELTPKFKLHSERPSKSTKHKRRSLHGLHKNNVQDINLGTTSRHRRRTAHKHRRGGSMQSYAHFSHHSPVSNSPSTVSSALPVRTSRSLSRRSIYHTSAAGYPKLEQHDIWLLCFGQPFLVDPSSAAADERDVDDIRSTTLADNPSRQNEPSSNHRSRRENRYDGSTNNDANTRATTTETTSVLNSSVLFPFSSWIVRSSNSKNASTETMILSTESDRLASPIAPASTTLIQSSEQSLAKAQQQKPIHHSSESATRLSSTGSEARIWPSLSSSKGLTSNDNLSFPPPTRNTKTVQVIQSTFFPHLSSSTSTGRGMADSVHRHEKAHNVEEEPAEEEGLVNNINDEALASPSLLPQAKQQLLSEAHQQAGSQNADSVVGRFKKSTLITTHIVYTGNDAENSLNSTNENAPSHAIRDLYVPPKPYPLELDSTHKLHYGFLSLHGKQKLQRISLDSYRKEKQIDLNDCDPIHLNSAAQGLILVQCSHPITHKLSGQLVIDQLTNARIQFNENIQAQKSYLSPDNRYLVSMFSESNQRRKRGTSPLVEEDSLNSDNKNSENMRKKDRHQSIIYVQTVNVDGLKFEYEVKTSLEIGQCTFVWKDGYYAAIFISTNHRDQQTEILSLRLADSRLELIVRVPGLVSLDQHKEQISVSPELRLAAISTNQGTYIVDLEENRITQALYYRQSPPTMLWV